MTSVYPGSRSHSIAFELACGPLLSLLSCLNNSLLSTGCGGSWLYSVVGRSGYEIRVISFAGSRHYRVPAFLLVPTVGKGPYPGVIALHDHGGWFYHGKEKLVRMDSEHASLQGFRDEAYGGRAFAEELARRGFVVLVPDALYWGERRLQYLLPPKEMLKAITGLRPEQVEYVQAMNAFLREQVGVFNTWLSFCGTSWLGIVNFDGRVGVDVLSGLPEVDRKRIGCLGLSGGGYRSTYLSGMEPRIRASVITGWMTSLPTTLEITPAMENPRKLIGAVLVQRGS